MLLFLNHLTVVDFTEGKNVRLFYNYLTIVYLTEWEYVLFFLNYLAVVYLAEIEKDSLQYFTIIHFAERIKFFHFFVPTVLSIRIESDYCQGNQYHEI